MMITKLEECGAFMRRMGVGCALDLRGPVLRLSEVHAGGDPDSHDPEVELELGADARGLRIRATAGLRVPGERREAVGRVMAGINASLEGGALRVLRRDGAAVCERTVSLDAGFPQDGVLGAALQGTIDAMRRYDRPLRAVALQDVRPDVVLAHLGLPDPAPVFGPEVIGIFERPPAPIQVLVADRQSAEEGLAVGTTHVWVSITDRDQPRARIPLELGGRAVLALSFDDVDEGADGAMKVDQARAVAAFLDTFRDAVRVVRVHCETGMGRSRALAAAIAEALGIGDGGLPGGDAFNGWVYRCVKEALAGNPAWPEGYLGFDAAQGTEIVLENRWIPTVLLPDSSAELARAADRERWEVKEERHVAEKEARSQAAMESYLEGLKVAEVMRELKVGDAG